MNNRPPYNNPEDIPEVETETLLDLESDEAIVGQGCPIDPEEREGCQACQ